MSAAAPSVISWAPVAVIDLNGTCTQLYFGNLAIGQLGINPLQLSLLLATLAFLLFLVVRIPCSVSKMNTRPNGISKIYYSVVWGTTLLCSIRILLTWFVWKEKSTGGEIMWLVTSTLFWGIEVSVFVFLFSSDVSTASKLIKRVSVITLLNMAVFATLQSVIIFVVEIRIYEYTPLSLFWWAPFNALRTLCYIFILLLSIIPCKHGIPLPTRKTFYAYAIVLCIIHISELVGSALIFSNQRSIGYCFVDGSLVGYFSLYPPLLYLVFLRDYFHASAPPEEASGSDFDAYIYESINT